MNVCNACSVAKARHKKVVRTSVHVQTDKPNDVVFLDLSRITQPMVGLNVLRQFWRIIVDESSFLNFMSLRME
jgi:hypothetical protein